MIRVQLPFQLKIFLLFFLVFALLLLLSTNRVNRLVSQSIIESNEKHFEGLKTIFYNLLGFRLDTTRNEALMLADQDYLRQALQIAREGKLVKSFLVQSFPGARRRDLIVVTDSQGNVIDGTIRLRRGETPRIIADAAEIQSLLQSWTALKEALSGYTSVFYIPVGPTAPASLFAVVSVPVIQGGEENPVLGTVSMGFPVDSTLANELRRGSPFHIGFVLGNEVVASTFEPEQQARFMNTWARLPQADQASMRDRARIIEIGSGRYLAVASSFPTLGENRGYYLILSPMEETMFFLNQLNHSLFLVRLFIITGALLVVYLLARRVVAPVSTLARAVSRIAEGDYRASATVRTGDELEILGREINRMAQTLQRREMEIQDYVKQIERWNQDLESKVMERTQDLEEKNQTLRLVSEELGRAYARIDEELQGVGELQKMILPDLLFDREGLNIRAFYLPNGRAGGDYYDYIPRDPEILFVLIADVAGHGTPAAFVMGITRAMAHTLIMPNSSPAEVLSNLSRVLINTLRAGEFVTMFLGRLDLKTLEFRYASAGHHPPLLFRKPPGALEELPVGRGMPLGIVDDPVYEELNAVLHPGDRLFLYTDGIVEAANSRRELYGFLRLRTLIRNHRDLPAGELLNTILRDLEAFAQRPLDLEPLEDDITLMVLDLQTASLTAPGASESG
ncbi:MAG: SpoIIE family protein phosphatase [bacterium]